MTTETTVAPNTIDGAAQQHTPIPSLESLATKMTAMRNQAAATRADRTGAVESATLDSPVAPEALAEEPKSSQPEDYIDSDTDTVEAQDSQEPVSTDTESGSSEQDIIDFIEFSETNPKAKFRFTRNGKEMIIDAKKAAAILGQGGAIHEEARELKIQRSEFEEYERSQRTKLEGLTLAMEFTIQPQLQGAYDEILKVQGYQSHFQQQLSQAKDAAARVRIQASMQQNEQYIQQQSQVINNLKPRVDEFRSARREQVKDVLTNNRKNFTDRELKNEYVYNEIREKVSKNWASAKEQLVPGVDNIDLISADEHILSLLRDGLKFRDRPTGKSAGASIAQLTARKGSTGAGRSGDQEIAQLREQANGGNKKAADNLLVARLSQMRASRGR
tara:strand:- start:3498 stop:4661 length:1164 start_codon:yes stop_codon:yes gene_type:complete